MTGCAYFDEATRHDIHMDVPSMTELDSDRFEPKDEIARYSGVLVCRAHDRHSGRDVVIKAERKATGVDNAGPTDVEREALIAEYLPPDRRVMGIREIEYRAGVDGRLLVLIVIDDVPGRSLAELLIDSPKDGPATGDWVDPYLSLCDSVAFLHQHGVVHMNITPDNAVMDGGVVRLGGLGSAHVTRSAAGIPPSRLNTIDPAYASPEALRARRLSEIDSRTDIYSLGVLLFRLHHPQHRAPYHGGQCRTPDEHRWSRPLDFSATTGAQQDVIAAALHSNRCSRYGSVLELRAAVEEAFGAERQDGLNRSTWATGMQCLAAGDYLRAAELFRKVPYSGQWQSRRQAAAGGILHSIKDCGERASLSSLLQLAHVTNALCPEHADYASTAVDLSLRVRTLGKSVAACHRAVHRQQLSEAFAHAHAALSADPASPGVRGLIIRLASALGMDPNLDAAGHAGTCQLSSADVRYLLPAPRKREGDE